MQIKTFKFPTFEDWEKRGNKIRLEIGAYCCEIRAFSWSKGSTTYMLAASLSNRNPLNIYTNKLFCSRFEYEGDNEKLKEWYETAISEFNTFFENHIKSTYFVE